MRWLVFKHKIVFVIALLLLPVFAYAQNGYDKRIEKYQNQWVKLIPTHLKSQYAGGMGLVSFGAGWDYGKSDQWETDVFLGFLPRYSTKENKITFTLKQNFIPWKVNLGKDFFLDPLACGLYINTILNGDFWVSEPDKYPNGYYSFSTRMRFNVYVGQRIGYKIPPDKRFFAKSISLFYELSTNDLYMASAFTNTYLKPTDYLRLSFGVKFQLF